MMMILRRSRGRDLATSLFPQTKNFTPCHFSLPCEGLASRSVWEWCGGCSSNPLSQFSTVIWKPLYIWEINSITPTSASLTVTRVSQLASAAIRTNNVVTNGKGGTHGIRRGTFVNICQRKQNMSRQFLNWRNGGYSGDLKRIYKTTFPIPLDKPLFLPI